MTAPLPNSIITVRIDGVDVPARVGQSIAAAMIADGRTSWRTTAAGRRPRGLFCGIGVCFDCLVTVNGTRDIRACQRPATDGDVIEFSDDALPTSAKEPS